MEQVDSAYETLRKQKAKKKRIRTAIIWAVIVLILAIGGFLIYRALSAAKETPSGGVLRYRYVRIAEGEIHTTITGSTTLSATDSASVTAAADARVKAVYKAPGETVEDFAARLVKNGVLESADTFLAACKNGKAYQEYY